jgi:hypothetical protein
LLHSKFKSCIMHILVDFLYFRCLYFIETKIVVLPILQELHKDTCREALVSKEVEYYVYCNSRHSWVMIDCKDCNR